MSSAARWWKGVDTPLPFGHRHTLSFCCISLRTSLSCCLSVLDYTQGIDCPVYAQADQQTLPASIKQLPSCKAGLCSPFTAETLNIFPSRFSIDRPWQHLNADSRISERLWTVLSVKAGPLQLSADRSKPSTRERRASTIL